MPRRRDEQARVLGPYYIKSTGYWQVKTVDAGTAPAAERSSCRYFGTEEEANDWRFLQLADLARIEKQTISSVLDAHESYLKQRGILEYSIGEKMRRLRLFFGPVLGHQLSRLRPDQAAELYVAARTDQDGKGRAVEYHRNLLSQAKGFMAWAIEEGYTDHNPLAKVKGVGVRNKGKLQLTGDEARKFHATALQMAQEGDMGALGSDMLLLMGLRQGEVVKRRVRDLDLDGTVLRIGVGVTGEQKAKTKKSNRLVAIPEVLQGRLRELAEERGALEWLFSLPDGRPHTRAWLLAAVKRVCKRAGVPRVTPHGLRGTHSTVALQLGVAAQLVADSLGHEDVRTTVQHYAGAGALEQGQQGRALAVIQGGRR